MSRTNRFLGGLSLGFSHQFIVLLVGLWLTPLFISRLGQHDYGVWLIITQITAYLGLLDLGVVGLLPRETAFAVGRGGIKSPELPTLVAQTAGIVLKQWPIVVLSAAVAWFLARNIWQLAELPLAIIILTFVIVFPCRLFSAILQGLQDLAFLGRSQIVAWTTGTATAVILVLSGYGLTALAASWAVNQFISSALCFFRLKSKFPTIFPARLRRLDRVATVDYLKKGIWISTSQIAQILTAGTDMLVIGKLLGPAATVPYSCTGKLAGVLANKPQMVMQAAFPALSELRTGGSRLRIRQATTALGQAMLVASGAVGCVVLAVNRGFVGWWAGPNQYAGSLLTLMTVVAMLVRHWNTTFTYSLFCFGHERRLAVTGVADGCVSLLTSAVLVWLVGPVGAPIGMLTGICLVNMPANLVALAREMATSPWSLLGSSLNWVGRFGVAAMAAVAFGALWKPHGLVAISTQALLSGALYLILVIPVLLREPLGSYLRPRLQSLAALSQRIFPVTAN